MATRYDQHRRWRRFRPAGERRDRRDDSTAPAFGAQAFGGYDYYGYGGYGEPRPRLDSERDRSGGWVSEPSRGPRRSRLDARIAAALASVIDALRRIARGMRHRLEHSHSAK